jgi:hypothetical protein
MGKPDPRPAVDEPRSTLAGRLRERLPELEAAVTTRVNAISDPREVADPAYPQSLRAALTTALEYALAFIELGERRASGVPPAVLADARLAARAGVALDALLRRYFAVGALLDDLLVEEAERAELSSPALRRVLGRRAIACSRR